MNSQLMACGPYFESSGLIATMVIFLLIKPLAYFAFVQAYRYRVSKVRPLTIRQVIGLAILRSLLGLIFVGGGALLLAISQIASGLYSWAYLYLSRLVAWWIVGKFGAGVRGARLVGWIAAGTAVNVAFDIAVVAGLLEGWIFPTVIVLVIAAFIALLHAIGHRTSLQARFTSDPLCRHCQYNLTGNVSGICPECGTPIDAADSPHVRVPSTGNA